MKKNKWDRCPYFARGRCPNSPVIDRAYLIPQFLDVSELEKAAGICGECELYKTERRKYTRLEKPFKSIIHKDQRETPISGDIVNVSGLGTLVKLNNWLPFAINEKVQIEIHPRNRAPKSDHRIIRTSGEVRRVHSRKRELALVFLQEVDAHSIHSL
jgi:hypothetical protein